jgi:hypothetical protein
MSLGGMQCLCNICAPEHEDPHDPHETHWVEALLTNACHAQFGQQAVPACDFTGGHATQHRCSS